jgi:two-component system sensor kinase FixL
VEISVADTGCGLARDSEELLFQPFFTTKKDGLGMGLSVSRSIVTSHGGQMWFSKNEDAGTTFFVTIPVVLEEDDA